VELSAILSKKFYKNVLYKFTVTLLLTLSVGRASRNLESVVYEKMKPFLVWRAVHTVVFLPVRSTFDKVVKTGTVMGGCGRCIVCHP